MSLSDIEISSPGRRTLRKIPSFQLYAMMSSDLRDEDGRRGIRKDGTLTSAVAFYTGVGCDVTRPCYDHI